MTLTELLRNNADEFGPVLSIDYKNMKFIEIDLSTFNEELSSEVISNPEKFEQWVVEKVKNDGADFTIGRYNEDRKIYDHSDVFEGETRRTVHLGIDLWVPAGTGVLTPLDARVHSFADNRAVGDYGPTIILEHQLEGVCFYTLYGHLSRESLEGLYKGKAFKKGDKIAEIGNYPVNGNWPPHLHFQVIKDMQGREGDFPGVTSTAEREKYIDLCPDPNLVLNLPLS